MKQLCNYKLNSKLIKNMCTNI